MDANKGDSSSNAAQWKHYIAAIQKFQHGFTANKYRAPPSSSQRGGRTKPGWGRSPVDPKEDVTLVDSQRRRNSAAHFGNGSTALTEAIEREARALSDADTANERSEITERQRIQNVSSILATKMQADESQGRLESEAF